jgi:hypothetical protein
MKSLADYTVVVRPDDNDTFVAYVPAISGLPRFGKLAILRSFWVKRLRN